MAIIEWEVDKIKLVRNALFVLDKEKNCLLLGKFNDDSYEFTPASWFQSGLGDFEICLDTRFKRRKR